GGAEGKESLGVVYHPTTTTKGNKVFLLAEVSDLSKGNEGWRPSDVHLKLVVGTVTNSTGDEPSGWIEWGEPKPLLSLITSAASKNKLAKFYPSGGSGVLMEDGTLVFSLMAKEEAEDDYSTIIYSTDNGNNWVFPEGTSYPKCETPRITEWKGSLLMIVDCENGQRVYESRDMGTAWTEAIGKLPGVWVNLESAFFWDKSLRAGALITATIEGGKVMLHTQKRYLTEGQKDKALYLWVTENNRTFHLGPVAMRDGMNWLFASSLLYSDGNLHLLQERFKREGSVISLSRLTEELSTINSVLSTWAQKDIFFSNLTIPTAGLVAFFSDAASDGRWIDEYLCVNTTVTNARKVKDGWRLTETTSGVLWPVNDWNNNVRHVSLSHRFTLVATVSIHQVPSNSTPLLTAFMEDARYPYIMGLSYTADNKW
ncbi:trans-sialidase, partial [Trypanosoma cruzi]